MQVDEAASGKEIIIACAGKPGAKPGPLAPFPTAKRRVLGRLAGQLAMPENFGALLPDDVLDAFEER